MIADRLALLCDQTALTGIDFVRVVDPSDQRVLEVYFLVDPDALDAPMVDLSSPPVVADPALVSIEPVVPGAPEITVIGARWDKPTVAGRERAILEITVEEPGDFSLYVLTIADDRVDRFFNGVRFSFKQGCPSRLDCRESVSCPSEPTDDFPVDYLARDFSSFRDALLAFASERFPDWSLQVEADAAVMFAELLAALGDDLSYTQDRHAREAFLETASQRRSYAMHLRLVDYELEEGRNPTTVLDVQLESGTLEIERGWHAWANPPGPHAIAFETDEEIHADAAWNAVAAHVADGADACLDRGATSIDIRLDLPDADVDAWSERTIVIEQEPEDPGDPRRLHLVVVTQIERFEDTLQLDDTGQPTNVTRLTWSLDQELPWDLCLTRTVVRGNIVNASAGETIEDLFSIGEVVNGVSAAIERHGPLYDDLVQRPPIYRHTLTETISRGLGWGANLHTGDHDTILLEEVDVAPTNGGYTVTPLGHEWAYRATLLESDSRDEHFKLEHGTWTTIARFDSGGETFQHADYAAPTGVTIRFGDGEFGRLPPAGTVFRAQYRTGPFADANLPRNAVTLLTNPRDDTSVNDFGTGVSVTNPFAITSGVDPETLDHARMNAPAAWRAVRQFAVRDDDYAEIAERPQWVQRAGAQARWTGSWLSEFVTVDPYGAYEMTDEQQRELDNLMDAVRQVGREVHELDPIFVDLDLTIDVCIEPDAYAGQVRGRIIDALVGDGEKPGFFDPNNFTFGDPLYRLDLEAAVQEVTGVRAVESMCLGARGVRAIAPFTESSFDPGVRRILRLENDPRHPERGTLRVVV